MCQNFIIYKWWGKCPQSAYVNPEGPMSLRQRPRRLLVVIGNLLRIMLLLEQHILLLFPEPSIAAVLWILCAWQRWSRGGQRWDRGCSLEPPISSHTGQVNRPAIQSSFPRCSSLCPSVSHQLSQTPPSGRKAILKRWVIWEKSQDFGGVRFRKFQLPPPLQFIWNFSRGIRCFSIISTPLVSGALKFRTSLSRERGRKNLLSPISGVLICMCSVLTTSN